MPSDKKGRVRNRSKRKFSGNQHTKAAKKVKVSAEPSTMTHDVRPSKTATCVPVSQTSLQRSETESCTATPTTSEKKLRLMYGVMQETPAPEKTTLDSDSEDDSTTKLYTGGHRIIDISILAGNIASQLKCAFCGKDVTLIEVETHGLGSMLAFECKGKNCRQKVFPSSEKITGGSGNVKNYGINRRAAFAMRSIGCDRAELRTFCGIMDHQECSERSSGVLP